MSYLMLILERADRRRGRAPAQAEREWGRMTDYAAALAKRGVLEGAQSLNSVAHGTRIEKRNGRVDIVDGPFAESKEVVGGFYHLKNVSRDEALAIAQNCPAAEWCSIELREIGPCTGA